MHSYNQHFVSNDMYNPGGGVRGVLIWRLQVWGAQIGGVLGPKFSKKGSILEDLL